MELQVCVGLFFLLVCPAWSDDEFQKEYQKDLSTYTNGLKMEIPSVQLTSAAGPTYEFACPHGFVDNEIPGALATFQYTKTTGFKLTGDKSKRTYTYLDLLCRNKYQQTTHVNKIEKTQLGSSVFHCNQNGWQLYEVSSKKKSAPKATILYRVCMDTNTFRPKFSFRLATPKEPALLQRLEDIWGFDWYGRTAEERKRLAKGFVKSVQTEITAKQYSLGKPELPFYFSRGHLTASADFIEADYQKATSEYLNVAPLLDTLNSGAWADAESAARVMLKTNPGHWEIYTGTYGTIQTPKGQVFVANIHDPASKKPKNVLPVPLLFWKLVLNTKDRALSRVFIGINNPMFSKFDGVTKSSLLCKTPTNKRGSDRIGLTYECPIDEFLAALKQQEGVVL